MHGISLSAGACRRAFSLGAWRHSIQAGARLEPSIYWAAATLACVVGSVVFVPGAWLGHLATFFMPSSAPA